MKALSAIVATCVALGSAPAHADWGPTRWGDPVEEVIASVGEGIVARTGTKDNQVFDQDLVAEREGEFHGIKVLYQFYVQPQSRGLSLVRMVPVDEARDCAAFGDSARTEFGQEKHKKRENLYGLVIDRSEWADRVANLAVLLSEFSGTLFSERSCLVTWQPYGSGRAGLDN